MKLRFHVAVLVGWVTAPLAWGESPFFYKVCGPYHELRELAGPELRTDAKTLELAVEKISLKGRLEIEFRDSVMRTGLYGSTPWIEEDVAAGSKLGMVLVCTVLTTGGVSFVVKEAITASKKLLDPQERKHSIARAVKQAEEACDTYVSNLVEGK